MDPPQNSPSQRYNIYFKMARKLTGMLDQAIRTVWFKLKYLCSMQDPLQRQ
ncbi:hypothetical protein D3C76_758480 [compost metagenome]